MKKRRPSAETDGITPAERETQIQDMLLKRADEIRLDRAAKRKRTHAEKARLLAARLKRMGHLKRCRDCKAMKFYLKNGLKIPK